MERNSVTNSAIAERYVRTYLDRDWVGLRAQMTDRIRTRGLLPQFVQESLGRDGAIQLMSGWLRRTMNGRRICPLRMPTSSMMCEKHYATVILRRPLKRVVCLL